jgi:hypothetical protein
MTRDKITEVAELKRVWRLTEYEPVIWHFPWFEFGVIVFLVCCFLANRFAGD